MADLVAADLNYSILNQDIQDKYRKNVVTITTDAGDYPTGGLPLTNAKLGMPNELQSLIVVEPSAADAFQYVWDKSANKIKVFEDDGTSGVPAEHANSAFTSPDELVVEVKGW